MARARAGRTQRERTAATTTALVSAAHELFGGDGYEATSLDAVAVAAGVTKGALYHHFDSKRELFAAVFAREVERLAAAARTAYLAEADPWTGFEAGCRAFLEACRQPRTQRIVLLDAQPALGWDTIRELEGEMLSMMAVGIERAISAGRIAPRPAGPLVSLLFGALCEGAMVVARAEDPSAAQTAMLAEVRRLLHGMSAETGAVAT
jgi:AcrR family transcriptional regulator